MSGQTIDLTDSYLGFFPEEEMENVLVFDKPVSKGDLVGLNKAIKQKEHVNAAIFVCRDGASLDPVCEWIKQKPHPMVKIHFVFYPVDGLNKAVIRLCYLWKIKRLTTTLLMRCQLLGVMGSPWKPTAVLSLRKNILAYVMAVGFRFFDGPLKVFLKKSMVQVFGAAIWLDSIVLVVDRDGTKNKRSF